MPVFEVEAPNGKVYEVTAPKGASQKQIVQMVKWQIEDEGRAKASREYQYKREEKQWQKDIDPTRGFWSNAAAGAGKAIKDAGRGVRDISADLFGDDEDKAAIDEEIQRSRQLDAPLMDTGGGMTGNVAGNVGMAALTAPIPGINTIAGAGAMGATLGAIQPTTGDESRLANTAVGAAGGAGGQMVANRAVGALAKRSQRRANPTPRESVIDEALQNGYRLDPVDAASKPGMVTRVTRGLAGKTQTENQLSTYNQRVTNELARRDLELLPGEILDDVALSGIRSETAQIYRQIGEVFPIFEAPPGYQRNVLDAFEPYFRMIAENPGDAVPELNRLLTFFNRRQFQGQNIMQRLRDLRANAAENLSSAPVGGSLVNKAKREMTGRIQLELAKQLENVVEQNLKGSPQHKNLYDAFVRARRRSAKSYMYEDAMTPGGDIDARRIASAMKKGVPISDEGRVIARTATEFPNVTKQHKGAPDAWSVLSTAGVGAGAGSGNPGVAAMFAARPATRNLVTSGMGQRMMIDSPYTAGMAQVGEGLLGTQPGQAMSRGLGASAAGAASGFWNPFEPMQPGGSNAPGR